MVTNDASKTGHGITLWQKQEDGNMKPIAPEQKRCEQNKKINRGEKNTSGQSDISASRSSCTLRQQSNTIQKKELSKSNPEITDMDRDILYIWGATRENMKKKKKKPGDP